MKENVLVGSERGVEVRRKAATRVACAADHEH